MLRHEDISNVSEIKAEFGQTVNVPDRLLYWLRFFEFKSVLAPLASLKSKGYSVERLLSVLILLPFLDQTSVNSLMKSGVQNLSESRKDSYYRLKNCDYFDWLGLLRQFVIRFNHIVNRNGGSIPGQRALIIDDTLLEKRGKFIEGVGRVWDHVTNRSVLGFRMLLLAYFDGKSLIPVNFSFHREKGKRADRPYGMTKGELKKQYSRKRDSNSHAAKRKKVLNDDKITTALKMIRSALRFLPVDYILMDSWFTSKKFIALAREKKVDLIGMVKMGNMNYTYNGQQLNAAQLLNRFKSKAKRCRRLSSHYIEVVVELDCKPVKLFFSRFGAKGKWHLILSANMSLTYLKMMEIYHMRWAIEVFFKEAKQYLNLGKSQSNDFSGQLADTGIAMIQYILITLKKRFGEYETKGEVFRQAKQEVLSITIDQRLWGLLLEVLDTLIEYLHLTIDDIENLMRKLANLDSIKKLTQVMPLTS